MEKEANSSFNDVKALMREFSQEVLIGNETVNMVIRKEDDFAPFEVIYLFKTVMGMKVKFRPEEKVAFILYFHFRGILAAFVLRKLSFEFHLQEVDDHVSIYYDLKEVLSKSLRITNIAFKEESKKSITDRNVILPNYIHRFEQGFDTLEKYIESNLQNKCDWPLNIHRADCLLNSYAVHLMSYTEHLITLLYPFSYAYDKQPNLRKFVLERLSTKIDHILISLNTEDTSTKNRLVELYKHVRNPIGHGYLTKDYFGDVLVTGLGYIPMSFSDYKASSQNYHIIPIDLDDQYKELCEVRENFGLIVDKLYPCAIDIVKSGLGIKCDPESRKMYMRIIQIPDETQEYIENYQYDTMINMDW